MFNIYYCRGRHISGKTVFQTVETEEEAEHICRIFEITGGYEDEYGETHPVDYMESNKRDI